MKTHPNQLSEKDRHDLYEIHLSCQRAITTKNRIQNAVRSAVARALLDGEQVSKGTYQQVCMLASRVMKAVTLGKELPENDKYDVQKAAEATEIEIENCELSCDAWVKRIAACDKIMVDMVKDMPIVDQFVRPLKGFGELSFARILAEAGGDLWTYPNPAKLWRRFGLAVINGEAQGHPNGFGYTAGVNVPKELWASHFISKRRRSISYVAFDPVIKHNGQPYKAFFDKKKAERQAKLEAEGNKRYKVIGYKHGHRLMEKEILKDLLTMYNDGNPAYSEHHELDTAGVITEQDIRRANGSVKAV